MRLLILILAATVLFSACTGVSPAGEKPEAKKARPERPEEAPAKQPLPAKGVCGPTLLSLLAAAALVCRRRVR